MDELDREEFFRLKKVKNVKEREKQRSEKESRSHSDKENEQFDSQGGGEEGGSNVLGDDEDKDVIF